MTQYIAILALLGVVVAMLSLAVGVAAGTGFGLAGAVIMSTLSVGYLAHRGQLPWQEVDGGIYQAVARLRRIGAAPSTIASATADGRISVAEWIAIRDEAGDEAAERSRAEGRRVVEPAR